MLFKMFNPLGLLVPPAIIILSLPLAFFAIITTSIAVSILTIRVSIIYVELAVAIIQNWLFGSSSSKTVAAPPTPGSPNRPRSRRGSVPHTNHPYSRSIGSNARSDSFASLIGPSGPNRDFEGVAGWKDTIGNEDEAIWIGRLELPGSSHVEPKRRHQRSHTAGSLQRRHSGSMRASPIQSRARTPISTERSEEYFTMQPHGRRPHTTESSEKVRDRQRKSSNASSSSGGSRLSLAAMKMPGS